MLRLAVLVLCGACGCAAETLTLTLRDAVELALKQNPDVLLARFEERKAEEAVRLARAPFVPAVAAGSGMAYSSGMPMSIEGATPSIAQAQATAYVFNKPQSYRVAAAKELRRSATFDAGVRQDEAVFRTAELYLQAQTTAKAADTVKREIEGLAAVVETVRARVAEGRELPIEGKRAELALARARHRLRTLDSARTAAESGLAAVLGLNPEDTVQTVASEWSAGPLPENVAAAIIRALDYSRELRALESQLVAKSLDVRSERAARLPRLDLVAQYALLGRFNNYEDFFRKFQRHNGQLGVSFQLPIFTGPAVGAAAARAEAEAAQLRTRIRALRVRIAADVRRAYDDIQQAQSGSEVARLDLEVAREQVGILLAQHQEGRASLRQVEDARATETEKWIAFYDAGAAADRARLSLLRLTGGLVAALR